MADDEIPVNPSFPPSNDLGPSSSGSEPSSVAKQRQGGKGVYDDYDLENSSKKNLYQISNPGRTKLYPVKNHGTPDLTAVFGVNYSKLYEAFSQNPRKPPCGSSSAAAAPARRPAVKNKSPRQKTTQESASLPSLPSPLVPSKRSPPSTAIGSKRVKLDPPATPDLGRGKVATPKGVARVVEKGVVGDTIKAKGSGSGIYTKGNWAWISDEEDGGKVDEKILAEARQIAAFAESSAQAPVKMTRRQLQDMKARASGASATTTPDPVQKSSMGSESTQGLAGKAVGSRRASRAAVNYNESTPTEGGDDEPTLSPKQRTPSTLESSMSHGSTPVPGQATRSTSASTMPHQADPDPEQLTRPKLSWNAIVYEVFVNSTIPEMTLPEIQQGVKDLFPYYALPENGKTLESSPRNPLYNHPSFLKTVRDDGKIAWSLIPGDFLDKKTGKVLNAVPSVKYTETSTKTAEDVDHTLSTPHLQTPPASNGGAEALESTSNDNHSPMGQALEMSPHENTNDDMEVDHDNGQVGEGLSRAVAANSPQEVPETQLPGSSPQKAVETQHPSSSVQEVIETQQPTLKQPSTGQSLHLSEQWRLENIVRECLMETFEDQDVEWFLQQTKLWYFKNMVLTQSDVAWILNDLFPIRDCISPASYMATCAEELQEHYREQMWASDWFEEFIRENVTQFDKMNEGFLKYADLTKPKRHNFWLARSLWNRDTCTRILSPLSDVIDAEKVWTTKHWHDCVEKLYATACDATCELRGQEYVFAMVKEALDERYPDRDSPSWNVPILKSAVKPRKPSIAASASAMGSGSAASPVRHTPIKTVFSPGPPWRGLSSKTTTKVGDAKENVRANSIEYLLNSTTD